MTDHPNRELEAALEVVASGDSALDLSDIKALRIVTHAAVEHLNCGQITNEISVALPQDKSR